jgi:hypothetical protein
VKHKLFVPKVRETIGQARGDAQRLANRTGSPAYLRCHVACALGELSGYFASPEPGPQPMATLRPDGKHAPCGLSGQLAVTGPWGARVKCAACGRSIYVSVKGVVEEHRPPLR